MTTDRHGIPQKWVVYHSAPMQEQQEKTFAKRLENDKKKGETSLRKLAAREFACEPDARVAAGRWLQENPLFCFTSMDIPTITREITKRRGRPKVGEPMETIYTVSAEIEYNPEVVAENRQKLDRFVLATNDLELSPGELLANYKDLGTVERGSRFLKDPSLRVTEIYLKKPSRIHTLAMIMVLCFFIYAMTEFRLHLLCCIIPMMTVLLPEPAFSYSRSPSSGSHEPSPPEMSPVLLHRRSV